NSLPLLAGEQSLSERMHLLRHSNYRFLHHLLLFLVGQLGLPRHTWSRQCVSKKSLQPRLSSESLSCASRLPPVGISSFSGRVCGGFHSHSLVNRVGFPSFFQQR